MIAGIKTAAEAKEDALVWQQVLSSNTGKKAYSILCLLAQYQDQNPTALEWNGQNTDIRMPTAAIPIIQATWGYVITSVVSGKPPGYSGSIVNWSRITKVTWNS